MHNSAQFTFWTTL